MSSTLGNANGRANLVLTGTGGALGTGSLTATLGQAAAGTARAYGSSTYGSNLYGPRQASTPATTATVNAGNTGASLTGS